MTEQNLAQIEKTYELIDTNWSQLWDSAATDEEKRQLQSARDGARDTFWRAIATSLKDNHSLVGDTRAALADANEELTGLIEEMESFAKTIKTITKAVTLAAALVTLGGI